MTTKKIVFPHRLAGSVYDLVWRHNQLHNALWDPTIVTWVCVKWYLTSSISTALCDIHGPVLLCPVIHMCYTGMYCTAICHITQKVSISVPNGWWNYEKKVNVACCYRSCDVINQLTWNKNCARVSTENSWWLSGHWPIWENTWGSIVDFNICRLQNSQIWLTLNLHF